MSTETGMETVRKKTVLVRESDGYGLYSKNKNGNGHGYVSIFKNQVRERNVDGLISELEYGNGT